MLTSFSSVLSSMEYAKTLVPTQIKRSVSTMHSAVVQYILPTAQPRPYRVCIKNRLKSNILVATSLKDLLEKASRSFLLQRHFLTLVLEEDGTVVDSDTLFYSFPANTHFMVLDKDEQWTQNTTAMSNFRDQRRNEIAKLSFDLYKLNPTDLLGCLTVQATMYEIYSLSYDIKCSGIKYILKSSLRCVLQMTKVTGQVLLYGSTCALQYIYEERR